MTPSFRSFLPAPGKCPLQGNVGAATDNAAMDVKGTTALVTGGADGIGAGIAERLAREGMHVVIADLDEEAGPASARPSTPRARSACLSTTPEASKSRASPPRTRRSGSTRWT